MIKRKFLLTAIAILLCAPVPASALKVIESDQFYVYFPEGDEPLADRISQWCAPMARYLSEQGLPIRKPVHILLDEDFDQPGAITQLYPHREIRLPLRAPGALEDGYTESDPWRYFLFEGLCVLGISNERSGLPGGAYRLFGEIISPNTILPEWTIDGISHLMWERYTLKRSTDPVAEAIFNASPIPGLDQVSHHPEVWPGKLSYSIYGRPFVRWLYQQYGWDKILRFLQLHGSGVIPIEIDLKAKRAFGMTWNQLWQIFQAEHVPVVSAGKGVYMVGYWGDPYYYWNETGVYPGIVHTGSRSRYGHVDQNNWLWTSEYIAGASQIKIQRHGAWRLVTKKHVWDPGPGPVAVTRQGHTPELVIFAERQGSKLLDGFDETIPMELVIAGPPGVLQMSGPVMDESGRIAVAANTQGNWDIWVFDDQWLRVTNAPSIDIDPWWVDGKLIFSSNHSGRFQIHNPDFTPLTDAAVAAMLPRNGTYLYMDATGWRRGSVDFARIPDREERYLAIAVPDTKTPKSKDKSLWPNYIVPDYFFNLDEFQLGVSTRASDVSREYAWNAGFRIEPDDGEASWRLGYKAKTVSTRLTRYPFTSSPQRGVSVDEMRLEANIAWSPRKIEELSLSANWQRYDPRNGDSDEDQEWWASIGWKDQLGSVHTTMTLDLFNDASQSLYGEFLYWYGEKVNTILRIQGGKTWGDPKAGHNTFRIGGSTGEGYFTQRSSRLFPLRGFDSNIIEADQAVSGSLSVLWPLVRLQTGYKTLPLFLHNITLGTFIDAGIAGDQFGSEDVLISAGVELVTGIQMAWESKSHFSIGLAWPLRKPDDIEQEGPVLLLLIGRPL
ncbi:MAG: hypothetical protein P8X96_25845 [Desulfobacteraceae bacterium]